MDIQIIIKTIAEGTGDKELQSSLKELNGAIGVVRTGYEVLNQVYDETIGKSQEYAEQVARQKAISGESAEESSRFIQVLDDWGLSADDAAAASRKLTSQGLVPNMETLAKLSDQYLSITDVQERNKFVTENLGRAGVEWNKVLAQGGDALRKQSKEVEAGLIFYQKNLDAAEELRLSQDKLNEAWQATALTLGTQLTPALTDAIDEMNLNIETEKRLRESGSFAVRGSKEYADMLVIVRKEADEKAKSLTALTAAQKDQKRTLEESIITEKEEAEIMKELSDLYAGSISLIDSMQSAEERYTAQSTSLAKERADTEADLAKFRAQGYWEQSDQIQGALGKLDEIKAKEAELAKEREKQTIQFISDILREELARDGWTEKEYNAFAQQQVEWGLWSENVMEQADKAWTAVDKIKEAIESTPSEKDITFRVNIEGGSIGGGGGGTTEGTGQGNALDWLAQHGFAQGTGGWMTIPPGYENDSYHMRVESGEKVNVVPAGQSVPQQSAGIDTAGLEAMLSRKIDEMGRTIVSALMQVQR